MTLYYFCILAHSHVTAWYTIVHVPHKSKPFIKLRWSSCRCHPMCQTALPHDRISNSKSVLPPTKRPRPPGSKKGWRRRRDNNDTTICSGHLKTLVPRNLFWDLLLANGRGEISWRSAIPKINNTEQGSSNDRRAYRCTSLGWPQLNCGFVFAPLKEFTTKHKQKVM